MVHYINIYKYINIYNIIYIIYIIYNIYILPISPDFNQKILWKNALLILFSQVIVLHEEHFKPIELWTYISEVL